MLKNNKFNRSQTIYYVVYNIRCIVKVFFELTAFGNFPN